MKLFQTTVGQFLLWLMNLVICLGRGILMPVYGMVIIQLLMDVVSAWRVQILMQTPLLVIIVHGRVYLKMEAQ